MRSAPGSVDTSNIVNVCRAGDTVDHVLLKEMLGYFIDENHHRMAKATRAVTDEDRESLRQIAHAVRGSAAMLGAGRLHDIATAIEHAALAGDLDRLREAVVALNAEFSAVLAALRDQHPEAWSD